MSLVCLEGLQGRIAKMLSFNLPHDAQLAHCGLLAFLTGRHLASGNFPFSLAGTVWLLTRNKMPVALRAFKVLRVYVRSLPGVMLWPHCGQGVFRDGRIFSRSSLLRGTTRV